MKSILISMCLCDVECRYDASAAAFQDFDKLKKYFNLIPVCPEIIGGLMTPRDPAERIGEKIMTNMNEDVTEQYTKGAKQVLDLAKALNCQIAILKEFSPSCGVNKIYDGTFTGNKIAGSGITAKLLKDGGLDVYSDLEVDKVLKKYF